MRIFALNWGKNGEGVPVTFRCAISAFQSSRAFALHRPAASRVLYSYRADFPETTVVDFERPGAHWRLFELDLDELDCTVSIVFNAALFGRRQHEIVIF